MKVSKFGSDPSVYKPMGSQTSSVALSATEVVLGMETGAKALVPAIRQETRAKDNLVMVVCLLLVIVVVRQAVYEKIAQHTSFNLDGTSSESRI